MPRAAAETMPRSCPPSGARSQPTPTPSRPRRRLERVSDRVLVTGAGGLVGRLMTVALVDAGYSVTALDQAFAEDPAADRVLEADGRDAAAVAEALRDVSRVIHLAGIPAPGQTSQLELFTNNTAATFTVLQLAADAGVRLAAIASSVQIYGYLQHRDATMPPYYPIDEHTPQVPVDAYPLAKHVDEASLRMQCARTGMAGVALRLPLMAPIDGLHRAADDAARHPEHAMRLGSGYLTPGDVGRLAVAIARAQVEGFHAVGISGPRTFAPEPTLELIARYAPHAEVRADLPGFAAPIDTTRARTLLGFDPQEFIEFATQGGPSPEAPLGAG